MYYLYSSSKGLETSIQKVIESLCAENPFYDWNFSYEYEYNPLEGYYAIRDHESHNKFLKQKIKAYEKAKEIISTMPENLSEYYKFAWIYNYITTDIKYINQDELDAYLSNPQPYIYDALIMKTTQCSGFSDTLTLMCNIAGIQTITVPGITEDTENIGHAWNLVNINGQFYNCDATSDSSDENDILKNLNNLKLNFLKSDDYIYSTIYKPMEGLSIAFPKASDKKYDVLDGTLTLDNITSNKNLNLIGKALLDREKYVIVHLTNKITENDPAINEAANYVLNYLCNNILATTRDISVEVQTVFNKASSDIIFIKTTN